MLVGWKVDEVITIGTGWILSEIGMSLPTIVLNVGAAAPPEVGPAQKVFAVCDALLIVIDPELVTGEPEVVNSAGTLRPTEVTVPLLTAAIVIDPAPGVTVIPVPGVIEATTGAAPVDPIRS